MTRQRKLPNGYARRHGCRAEDVDADQLRIGTAVEMEHTRDRKIARQIALDHLCENKRHKYYVRSNVRHERLLLKRSALAGRGSLGGRSCSTSPRWVRGGVGMLLGTLLGGMIGGGVALAVTTTSFDITEPVDTLNRAKNMAVLTAVAVAIGATSGLTIGVWKPEC